MENQMFDLADRLKDLKNSKRLVESELKAIQEQLDATETQLAALMVDTETQSFNRSGTMFYLSSRTYASAEPDQKLALFEALAANGFGALVTQTVNANSLSAFVKEQMGENDDALPGWLAGKVRVFEKTTIGVRSAK